MTYEAHLRRHAGWTLGIRARETPRPLRLRLVVRQERVGSAGLPDDVDPRRAGRRLELLSEHVLGEQAERHVRAVPELHVVRAREVQALEHVARAVEGQRVELLNPLQRAAVDRLVRRAVERDLRAQHGIVADLAAIERVTHVGLLDRILDVDLEVVDRELQTLERARRTPHDAERGGVGLLRLDVRVAFQMPRAGVRAERVPRRGAVAEDAARADDLAVVQLAEVAGARIA